ncbi:hypothetical protein C2845_PM14G08600 [Panicum miliaceum]|uniref:Uncharacterized protein n=1 Tax=Panicum miliaceum TaxID=4540 RepID=A0A3L6PM92_PANMI|nr:hypothetical protein C2845_PM14G08600 [Panicum miliaceum]
MQSHANRGMELQKFRTSEKNAPTSLLLGGGSGGTPAPAPLALQRRSSLPVTLAAGGSQRGRKEGGGGAPPPSSSPLLPPRALFGSGLGPWRRRLAPTVHGRIRTRTGRIRLLGHRICLPGLSACWGHAAAAVLRRRRPAAARPGCGGAGGRCACIGLRVARARLWVARASGCNSARLRQHRRPVHGVTWERRRPQPPAGHGSAWRRSRRRADRRGCGGTHCLSCDGARGQHAATALPVVSLARRVGGLLGVGICDLCDGVSTAPR